MPPATTTATGPSRTPHHLRPHTCTSEHTSGQKMRMHIVTGIPVGTPLGLTGTRNIPRRVHGSSQVCFVGRCRGIQQARRACCDGRSLQIYVRVGLSPPRQQFDPTRESSSCKALSWSCCVWSESSHTNPYRRSDEQGQDGCTDQTTRTKKYTRRSTLTALMKK